MARSFICFDNQNDSNSQPGFWISDYMLQVACSIIVKAIDDKVESDSLWLKNEMRKHIYNNSVGLFVGFMHLNFSEFLINDGRKTEFLEVLNNAKQMLSAKPFLSVEELNSFRVNKNLQGEWLNPLPTQKIIIILHWIEKLIKGELTTTVYDRTENEFL